MKVKCALSFEAYSELQDFSNVSNIRSLVGWDLKNFWSIILIIKSGRVHGTFFVHQKCWFGIHRSKLRRCHWWNKTSCYMIINVIYHYTVVLRKILKEITEISFNQLFEALKNYFLSADEWYFALMTATNWWGIVFSITSNYEAFKLENKPQSKDN